MVHLVPSLVAAAFFLVRAPAQQWVSLETAPVARTSAASAADPRTGRMLLFGGAAAVGYLSLTGSDVLWQWTGQSWVRRAHGAAPPARTEAAMALDAARGRVVLFGGHLTDGSLANDTWEWDGAAWLPTTPGMRPPPSDTHALAHDPLRGRTVAFGGNLSPWTWEWDGTNWRQSMPAVSPPGRIGTTLVFDAVRGRVLLFGGCRHTHFSTTYGNDLWEYDGVTWTPVAAVGARPVPRAFHSAAWHAGRNRMVVFGGERGFLQLLSDTWEWDGQTWHATTPATSPPPLWSLAMNYDTAQQRTVLAGAVIGSGTSTATTWHWDGSTWSAVGNASAGPETRSEHGFVQDAQPGRCVLFGGTGRTRNVTAEFGDTWLWQGGRWTRAQPSTSPAARYGFAMAYDSGRRRVVLFGGSMPGSFADDTWEWDGVTWQQVATGLRPPPRAFPAMTYDAARGVAVLFGGSGVFVLHGDAWTWDGTAWRSIPAGPPPRWAHTMTFDPTRQVVVMYGGNSLTDLWEWNGIAWAQGVAPPGAARMNAMLFHDASRGRTVLHGGWRNSAPYVGETLEWDGVAWTSVATVLPPTNSTHTAAFDPRLGRTIVFDGTETWAYSATAATATSTGDPCPGIPGLPTLAAAGRPFVGNRTFGLWLDGAPPSSPCAAFLALAPAAVPLPGSCSVLLAQPQFFAFGLADAIGGLLLPMALPADNRLRGVRVFGQAIASQAGGPMLGSFAPTARLDLLLGD